MNYRVVPHGLPDINDKLLSDCGMSLMSGIYGVEDDDITSSSDYDETTSAQNGRLFSSSAWAPAAASVGEYIQVGFWFHKVEFTNSNIAIYA